MLGGWEEIEVSKNVWDYCWDAYQTSVSQAYGEYRHKLDLSDEELQAHTSSKYLWSPDEKEGKKTLKRLPLTKANLELVVQGYLGPVWKEEFDN